MEVIFTLFETAQHCALMLQHDEPELAQGGKKQTEMQCLFCVVLCQVGRFLEKAGALMMTAFLENVNTA